MNNVVNAPNEASLNQQLSGLAASSGANAASVQQLNSNQAAAAAAANAA